MNVPKAVIGTDSPSKKQWKLPISTSLKQIAEGQKVKISSLREERNALLDNVDQLEFKQKNDDEMMLRMMREMRDLKVQIRDLRMDVIEKEEVIKEQSDNVLSVNALKTKANDLEDKIVEG